MNIKGFDELRMYLPDLNSTGGRVRIALIALGVFTLTTVYFIRSDQIPTWTIDSQIVVLAIGFMVFSLFFSGRKATLEKYRERAYRHAFMNFALPGLAIILASIAHIAYMNGPKWPSGKVTTGMTVLGWYWIIVGAILWFRSVLAFGVDNLSMLYVYFPENGRIINSNIYGILRHPVYAAALRVGIGLALLNTSIYALTFIPFFLLGFTGWIRLVEEKELLERFPEYSEYRKQVPAFWVKPRDIEYFWSFLINGK